MKYNLQTKKLGEICSIKTGKKDVNQGNPSGKYPFFTCAREHTFSDAYSFDTEALLVAGNGDVGHVSYFKGKFEAYQRTYVLSDFNDVDPRYIFLFLEGFLKETVSKQKLGNTMPYIKMGMLSEFNVPVMSMEEQKQIMKILDEAIEKIAKAKENAEKNLQNSNELFESSRESFFLDTSSDWKNEPLSTLCSIKHGFAFKSKYFSSKGDYVLLTPGNFYESGGYRDRKDKQKYYNGEIPKGYILEKGDLLVAMTEQAVGLLGGPVIIPESNKFLHNQRLGLIQFKEPKSINPGFFFHHFNRKIIRDQIQHTATGVKVRHTSPNKLLELVFTIPPIKDQDSIVKKLDLLSEKTKKLEANYKQKIADLNELKKSLLTKAFAGEL